VGGGQQAFDHLSIFKVGLYDLVNVLHIDKAVPNSFRVYHCHRTSSAAVQTACFVHSHLAGPGQSGRLHLLLTTVKSRLCLMLGAASLAIFALIETKENVPLVV
jgi:hypothetical protein